MLDIFTLQSERLVIRPFRLDDLEDVHRILDDELGGSDDVKNLDVSLRERRKWLTWQVESYEALARLYQLPTGDRAVALKDSGRLIGAAGYVTLPGPFPTLPSWGARSDPAARLMTFEFGLFYAISPMYRRHGYASEAAFALMTYAFDTLKARRLVATTSHDNLASQNVMRSIGMRLETNPFPEPEWFQVVGVIDNPRAND